jgi:hypothetical protein
MDTAIQHCALKNFVRHSSPWKTWNYAARGIEALQLLRDLDSGHVFTILALTARLQSPWLVSLAPGMISCNGIRLIRDTRI